MLKVAQGFLVMQTKFNFAILVVRIKISYLKKPSWFFCRDTEMKTATAGQGLPLITHRWAGAAASVDLEECSRGN